MLLPSERRTSQPYGDTGHELGSPAPRELALVALFPLYCDRCAESPPRWCHSGLPTLHWFQCHQLFNQPARLWRPGYWWNAQLVKNTIFYLVWTNGRQCPVI